MPDTARPRFGLQAFLGADNLNTIDGQNDAQMDTIDALAARAEQGTFASRPTSTPGTPGIERRFYYATDQGILYLDHGTGWKEVRIGDITLSDDDFAASAGMYATYREQLRGMSRAVAALTGGAVYFFNADGTLVQSGITSVLVRPFSRYFDDADYAIAGRTQKLRVRVQAYVNATAPGVTYTVGLHEITASGGSPGTGHSLTLGAAVSGSTVAFAAPAANSRNQGNSGDFTIPADGHYALGVVPSGSPAGDSSTLLVAEVQSRYV